MKITDMKLFYVPPRSLFLKIETDAGISGWGEPLVEGRAATLEAAVEEWKDYFIGKDPLLIEDHWQTMYRGAFYRGGPVMMSTISGIDEALWDIMGKFYNAPVYKLMGGPVKDKVKVYRGIGGATPELLAKDALLAKEQGYSIVKCSPLQPTHYIDTTKGVDEVLKMLYAVREAIGNELDLAIDLHGRIHRPMAKVLSREFVPLRLAFIEEPVLPTNKEALREVAMHNPAPIAMGERMYSRWDFKDMLQDGYVDILQPDLSHAGGVSECRRIGAMAEAYDVALAPHCPLNAIAFASCLQIDGCTPNAVFQEQSIGVHDTFDPSKLQYLKSRGAFGYENGFVQLPDAPGLGIEIDEEWVVEASKTPHNWKNPLWRTYDGTRIEW